MGVGVYGIEFLETENPSKCIVGETTELAMQYYWNGGVDGVDPLGSYVALEVAGLPSGMTAIFQIGGVDIPSEGFTAGYHTIPITLKIVNVTATLGLSEIIVNGYYVNSLKMSAQWALESVNTNNYLNLTSGDYGKIVRDGAVLQDNVHTVYFSYVDSGSENDAGKTVDLTLLGLPTGFTYQFKNLGNNNISSFTLPNPIPASIPMSVVITGDSTIIAPSTYTINIRAKEGSTVMSHLSTVYFTLYGYGEVDSLATTGQYIACGNQGGDDWHGTIFIDDNSTQIHPIVYKYWSGGSLGGAISLSVVGLPTGATCTFHTDPEGTSSAVTSFGGGTTDDIVYAKFVVANNATAVSGDAFTIRGFLVNRYEHSIPCVIFIEDNYQISVSVSESYGAQQITGGQMGKFTITATRLTPNCSGVVNISPSHSGNNNETIDGHSFNWSTGSSELTINQHISEASVDYEISPHLESDDQSFTVSFDATVYSSTDGDMTEQASSN